MLETSIQRGLRSVVSIGCFILDFYFFLPNFGSSVQITPSSIDSSNIKKRFQSKKFQKHQSKDISEFWKRGLQLCGAYIRIIPPNGVLLLPSGWWSADTLPTLEPMALTCITKPIRITTLLFLRHYRSRDGHSINTC